MRRIAVGLLGALVWVLAELLFVAARHRAELTSGWELGMGTLWLAPCALLLATPSALAAGFIAVALERPSNGRAFVVCAAAAAAAAIAALVTTGRHFVELGPRVGAVLLVGVSAGIAAWAAFPFASAAERLRPARFARIAVLVAVAFEAMNENLLVRLYPAFHAGLAVASVTLAALASLVVASRWRHSRWAWPAPALALVVLIAAVGLASPAAARLARFDNFRLFVAEHSPVLAPAVRLAAMLSPPPPMDETGSEGPAPAVMSDGGPGPSFAGRDILLVTIDALRADHVGAYGYDRPTTPHIDALARDSLVFERAYCPTPHTSYSLTSLMTGKYMRPLLLEGTGRDSETLATFLRTYGYRTAAFYPPAVFFIDRSRFTPFEASHFGFEYRKVEFLEGEGRVKQVATYLSRLKNGQRFFLWVHLFGPHEPYEAHSEHPFGDRDIDRYDSEIAAADDTVGAIVGEVRGIRPGAVVIVTADHGEEFGDHGGRYHGTSVYEEQIRVPLVLSAPGLVAPRRVREVVQTIDLLPTVLAALAIPRSPRIRGRNLGSLLGGSKEQPGFAFAETDDDEVLAEGSYRLLCERKLGACRLYDLDHDAAERTDRSSMEPERFRRMRTELGALAASQGRFEREGLRAETGKGWPAPILRAIAGDADVALDLSSLLDDSDRDIRRKAAELLLKLDRPETIPALRLALGRDEDATVRRFSALALTRLGEDTPLTLDILNDPELIWRRRAALALAESGDGRGQGVLVDWWQQAAGEDHELALELLAAFAKIRAKDAVWSLTRCLGDVRLRPAIAQTLAKIGDTTARGPLVAAFTSERYETARVAIAEALVALGAKDELARPLVRFLGVPDPLPGGIGYALRAGVLESVGGPDKKTLAAITAQGMIGVRVRVVVPKGGNGQGVRVVVRARAVGAPGQVRLGKSLEPLQYDIRGYVINTRQIRTIHDHAFASVTIPGGGADTEVAATLPGTLGVHPGQSVELILFAEPNVHVEGLAVVPLADELPPPPPEPWTPGEGDDSR